MTNALSDADAPVRNITYHLYSDALGNSEIASQSNGNFALNLAFSRDYWVATKAEALNASSGVWEQKTSALTKMTTPDGKPEGLNVYISNET